MARYSLQPRDRILLKGYGLLSFARNMAENIGKKNISKNLSSKYILKLLDHAKQSATDVLKSASKTAIQKTAEATGDFIGNKIAYKITRVSKTSPQNDEEILRERYISPEERQKIIHNIRLI